MTNKGAEHIGSQTMLFIEQQDPGSLFGFISLLMEVWKSFFKDFSGILLGPKEQPGINFNNLIGKICQCF